MESMLRITDDNWSYGSYYRKDYTKDMLYTFFSYKEVSVVYHIRIGSLMVTDKLVQQMYQNGWITSQTQMLYEKYVRGLFANITAFDEIPLEAIYDRICTIRKTVLGTEALEQVKRSKSGRMLCFDPAGGIDQSERKARLLRERKAIIILLCETEWLSLMQQDMEMAKAQGCELYLVAAAEPGQDMPTEAFFHSVGIVGDQIRFLTMDTENGCPNLSMIQMDPCLQKRIYEEQAALLVYGEEGLLHCKNLRIPSVIHAVPRGYYPRALTNQQAVDRACVVYVPAHYTIIPWVGLTQKTRVSYWQLAKLWQAYGDAIYDCTAEQLYEMYPQYFLNIYENGTACTEAAAGYPIQVIWPHRSAEEQAGEQIFGTYDRIRDQAIRRFFEQRESLQYDSTYFDAQMRQQEIPWGSKQNQTGIMVQAIRVRKAGGSGVIDCEAGKDVRRIIRELAAAEEKPTLRILSNFLFFMTPKLIRFYNDLRADRPKEQLTDYSGHLDYMLRYENGQRIESIPLFDKPCIAMKQDGRFLIFNFRLGGGQITVDGYSLKWPAEAVDQDMEEEPTGKFPVCVYTPFYSQKEEGADYTSYTKMVGQGRINLVVVQNELLCVRRGDVMLPSVGAVISLDLQMGEALLSHTGWTEAEDGYYECGGCDLCLCLDGPKEVAPEEWKQVVWAYGGGLSVIRDGRGISDEPDPKHWFRQEGWMSPLSGQTQETPLHQMVKHPRTAIGMTEAGDLVIMVFSGRTKLTTGADYNEMCRIARIMYPDMERLVNVDGGGSAMLGMAIGSSFMELSYPATSLGSTAGMVRPVNTLLCLEAEYSK